ncbi:MAG: WD40 repeat domain-containing protein [Ktedonobacteraceae bacterium]
MTHARQEKAHDHTISRRTFVVCLSGLLGASTVGSVLASCQSLAQQPATPSNPTTVPTATTHSNPTPAPAPGTTLYVYRGHSSAVSDLSWSPDSTSIASASGGIPYGAGDNAVHVWNAQTGKNTFILQNPPNGPPTQVAWSPDGTRIASSQYNSGNSFQVAIWNARTGHVEIPYRRPTSIFAFTWSPDSTRIASAWYTDVEIFNATTGREVVSYPTSLPPNMSEGSNAVAWSPDGTTIVSAAHTGHSVQFWDAHTGQLLHYFSGSPLIAVAWSPNGKLVAIQSFGSSMQNGLLEVRDAATGHVVLSYTNSFVPTPDREQTVFGYIRPHNISWSPDSRYIAVPNHVTTVELWDITKQNLAYTYRGHTDIVYAVAWSPDGTRIASASNDKTVRVWQAV